MREPQDGWHKAGHDNVVLTDVSLSQGRLMLPR